MHLNAGRRVQYVGTRHTHGTATIIVAWWTPDARAWYQIRFDKDGTELTNVQPDGISLTLTRGTP